VNVDGSSVDLYVPNLPDRLAVKRGVVRECWKDLEFCEFAPVSMVGRIIFFLFSQ
jgi:hypothetical protein